MIGIKTEMTTVEEHKSAMRKAIELRAYRFYERDGFADGHGGEHWLQAEQDLTRRDIPHSVEDDTMSLRFPLEEFGDSTLLVSIAAHSVLIFSCRNDNSAEEDSQATEQECLHILALPLEVDADRADCEFEGKHLHLRLPLVSTV